MSHHNLPVKLICLMGLALTADYALCQEVSYSSYTPDTLVRKVTSPVLAPVDTVNISTKRAMAGPSNDNFSGAISVVVNAAAITGTNYLGTLEVGENLDCNAAAAVSSVWYSFNSGANSTLYVNVAYNAGFYYTGAAVWSGSSLPTGNCQAMQCQDNIYAGLASYSMELTNLSPSTVYYIQMTYPVTTDNNYNFSLSVTTTAKYTVYNPPPVNTCATAVPGCYINSYNPSAATIEASCTGYQFQNPPYPHINPYTKGALENGYVYSLCYYFTNLNTSGQLNIQNLFYTCAGNSYWLDWTLYDASCNPIECGNLNNLTVNGVACNTQYTICETFEAACNFLNNLTANKYGIYPFASWPSASPATCSVLPIKLLSFNVDYEQPSNTVYIDWSTATETNNKLFTVEKSVTGGNWSTVATVPGAGNSSTPLKYSASDENPYPGVSYYRLKQTDFDGHYSYSDAVPVNIPTDYSVVVYPNPSSADATLKYSTMSPDPVNVTVTDLSGKTIANYTFDKVQQGVNNFTVPTASLAQGMYFMKVSNPQKTFYLKFVKQ